MKRVCFVVSHLGSGSSDLVEVLNGNPRCEIYDSGTQYDNPAAMEWMFNKGHKCRDSSAVYGDHLLFNTSMSHKSFYGFCKFIYVIRPARASLNEIVALRKYTQENAAKYYRFRLRRMCEMAKRSPDSVLLTWDDLAKGTAFPIIEDYLGLPKQLRTEFKHFSSEMSDVFKENLIEECQDAYERYYYYLDKLKLRRSL
jgi:hypothetical protein